MGQKVTFGEKHEGIQYKTRQGVYGVILNHENSSVAVVKTSTGCFLPGGGIESDESHEECLKRECLEEIGYEIRIGDFVGRAEQYFFSPTQQEYMVSDCFFYFASVIKKIDVPIEDDHELVWISQNDIKSFLFHEHQMWAVKQAISFTAD